MSVKIYPIVLLIGFICKCFCFKLLLFNYVSNKVCEFNILRVVKDYYMYFHSLSVTHLKFLQIDTYEQSKRAQHRYRKFANTEILQYTVDNVPMI